jgi:predicted transcriptional regulator
METLKDINTSLCDILRLKEAGLSPSRIAEDLGCSVAAVRAFLRAESRLTPQPEKPMPARLQEYLSKNGTDKAHYKEILMDLDTYRQSLNYAIKILLDRGIITCTEGQKYSDRLYWLTNA